jgi:hypothetical protein
MRAGQARLLAAFVGLASVASAVVPAGLPAGIAVAAPPDASPAPPVEDPLRSPSDFAGIMDPSARSVALFVEAARVIQSPRCLNCHPATRMPTQGEDLHPHVPYMQAGIAGHGPAGLNCAGCHQPRNVVTQGAAIETIPGHPHWALAPASMAWQGKSLGEICRQIKDPARNGHRNLAAIREHMSTDGLVGWAWNPGSGRKPAPGTQQEFGRLVAAWIETGAACPTEPTGAPKDHVMVKRPGDGS